MKGKTGKEGKNVVTKGKQQHGQGRAKKPTQEATKQELTTHRIAAKKTELKKKPFIIRSVALAADNEEALEHLKQDATDALGRPISGSAVLRALVRYLSRQPSSWVAQQLHPLIEAEIEEGRLWGTWRKTGKL